MRAMAWIILGGMLLLGLGGMYLAVFVADDIVWMMTTAFAGFSLFASSLLGTTAVGSGYRDADGNLVINRKSLLADLLTRTMLGGDEFNICPTVWGLAALIFLGLWVLSVIAAIIVSILLMSVWILLLILIGICLIGVLLCRAMASETGAIILIALLCAGLLIGLIAAAMSDGYSFWVALAFTAAILAGLGVMVLIASLLVFGVTRGVGAFSRSVAQSPTYQALKNRACFKIFIR